MKRTRILITSALAFIFLVMSVIFIPDMVVKHSCRGHLYGPGEDIPHNRTGLVLGTAKYLSRGKLNLYYKYRIEAAVALFNAGKVDFLLVSGDNWRRSYNEPIEMKKDLVAAGVPEAKIFLDYAGFRTLDSVVRSKYIFGQDSITIISQKFHNERAVFIAGRKDIYAIGFNARDVDVHYGFRTMVREKFARGKMFLDLLFDKKPKFLGEKIEIK